jgi:ATP-dependent exoDNAse (exonuclease V) alpha subunit
MRVASVIGGMIRLESVEQKDGRPVRSLELLANKPMHLEHAYASTVHSSQGLTNDRALIALDTKSRTTSMNLYYVAISRARHEARIYTNSCKELPVAIARRYDKSTALAIQRERQLQHRDASTPPKGTADGKQALQRHQFEQERKLPSSGNKPKGYGRFG